MVINTLNMRPFSKKSLLALMLITLTMLLNACSTVKKDGPPPFDVDVSKIPDAVPKAEKLSKYGNQPKYYVFGKPYYVMKSSKNYEERGVASWYGTKFHARHTSTGERYDMLGMTAAHKTLPLPTYVQVTNLANGKKVIVKVNDRGPFEANRIIDLSYVAAKKLGMIGHGTAHVDVKAIDPLHFDNTSTPRDRLHNDFFLAKNSIKVSDHPAHHARGLYLQVGAFKNKAYAEHLKKRLEQFVSSPIKIANSKHLYRVQIGPIEDNDKVHHISKRLKELGLNSHRATQDITEV